MKTRITNTVGFATGALSNDATINNIAAGGCVAVSAACVGGVVLNVMAAAPVGAVYYAGLAAVSGATGAAMVMD